MIAVNGQKRCPRCKETLPVERFGKQSSRPDGLNTYCRDCRRAIDRGRSHAGRPILKRTVFRERIYPFAEVALREDWTLVLDTLTPADYREAFGCSRSCSYTYFHRAAYDFSDAEYHVVWNYVYDKARKEVTHGQRTRETVAAN